MTKNDQQDQEYIREELADAAEDPNYVTEANNMPQEREMSLEKMRKHPYDKNGNKQ